MAQLRILLSYLLSPKTPSASVPVVWECKTTLNWPESGPFKGIQSLINFSFEIESTNRINARASKFTVSFPFLNSSSSSKTWIGMATSCSWKFLIALLSYRITEVSITKTFRSGSFLFDFTFFAITLVLGYKCKWLSDGKGKNKIQFSTYTG